MTMRAVVLTRRGPPEVLEVQRRSAPEAGAGEVRFEVRAAGVNFSDVLARVGLYPNAPKPPTVLGYEVAGTVTALGPGVEGLAVGDRAVAFVRRGGYAEQAVARAGDVLALPAGLSFEQGAAIPLSFGTAYGALVRYGGARRGERILIHGAGGGVGSAAAGLARALGLEVWGTASAHKHEAVRRFGVEHPIDYRAADWERRVPPVDLVLDALGGSSFRRSYRLLRPGGRLVCFGASSVLDGERRSLIAAARTLARTPRFKPMRMIRESKSVIGLDTIALWEEKGNLAELIEPLGPFLAAGEIVPAVAARCTFEQAAEAHRLLGERANVGKVVLVP